MENSRRLSPQIKNILQDPKNQIFLSVASIWEIVLKVAKKKLKVPMDIETGVRLSGFTVLPIDMTHVLGVGRLPFIHKDPFDRMLISQSQAEKLILITSDEKIWKYHISLLKC